MTENNDNNVHVEESDYTFIQEKIKDRPVNKKRLFRKMLFTITTAIIFGVVACVSFLLLEPVVSKMISSNEAVNIEQITLPEVFDEEERNLDVEISDAVEEELPIAIFEETPIEDMTFEDVDNSESASLNEAELYPQEITVKAEYEVTLDDYHLMYRKMYAMSELVSKSLVTITGVSEGSDKNIIIDDTARTSGLIIGNNGQELMIFADGRNIKDEQHLVAIFNGGESYDCVLKKMDDSTNLAIYGVNIKTLSEKTKESYTEFTLGTSYSNILLGSPVLAVGNPLGTTKSICYGMVTSMDTVITMEDSAYQLITTDIIASKSGYGFLFNTRGQFIGIITPDNHSEDLSNMVYAYGISSLRGLMEDLSNEKDFSRIGLYLNDIPDETRRSQGVPSGVYISQVTKDSPAMNVGLQPGDIISEFNGEGILRVNDYIKCLRDVAPGDNVKLTILRYSGDQYKNVQVEITAEEK